MNKIYKVIWSKTRNCYVAVAEFVKRNGKGSSLNCRHIAAALAVAICVAPAGALAASTGGSVDGAGNYIGDAPYNVTINEEVKGVAYGRYETDADVDASGATLSIVAGGKADAALGGRAVDGVVTGNKVEMTGGEIVGLNPITIGNINVSGMLIGGFADTGNVEKNTVELAGGTVNAWAVGGFSSKGEAKENSITISGGTVSGMVFGGYSWEGDATTNNTVTISGGTAGHVYGGRSESNSGNATNNTVIISGGTVNYYVYGGNSDSGSATSNTVTISGGTVNYVYGGYSWNGDAVNNTVILSRQGSEAPPVINGTLFGGYGRGTVSDNTLQVEAVGLSAPEIQNFDTYRFVLPSDIKAVDTMLTLSAQNEPLTIDANKVDMAVAKGSGLNIDFGESITLLHKTGGSGAFSVTNLTGEVQTSKLDGEAGGFDVMKYKLENPADKLNVTVSELYLYGDGGTNMNGQREIGNTLTIKSGKANAAFGGRAKLRANENSVTMEGGELVLLADQSNPNYNISGNLYGGYAGDIYDQFVSWAIARDNTVKISGGKVERAVYGGYSDFPNDGGALGNTVEISGGTIGGTVLNAYVYGGYTKNGNATGNTVVISGGTVGGEVSGRDRCEVYGGYAQNGNATGNTVVISGGTIGKDVYGEGGTEVRVYGGYSKNGNATGNTVVLGEGLTGRTFGTLYLHGSNKQSSDNTLRVEGRNIYVRSIGAFENYTVMLPQSVQAGDTILACDEHLGDLILDGSKVRVVSGGRLGLSLGESVTILKARHYPAESPWGKFELNNADQIPPLTERLDNEATGFVTLAGKTEMLSDAGNYELNLTVTEKYLYGDGGTNTPGQRETGNTLTITGGKANAAFGGRASSGAVTGNKVEMSGGEIVRVNTIWIGNRNVSGDLYGGFADAGNVEKNTVKISDGTVKWSVFGGYSLTSGIAIENSVTVSGGTVGSVVYGGYSQYGDVAKNTVTISGGEVKGSVYGGYSFAGDAANNTVILSKEKEAPVLNGTLFGGLSDGGGAVSGNTLQVEATGLSAPEIQNFDNYRFVLPDGSKKGDVLLSLNKQDADLTIDGRKVSVIMTGSTVADIGLKLDESVTLLEKTGGSGRFAVDNPQQLPKLEDKLDGVGFTTMVGKVQKSDREDKLYFTLTELHLYGDGGTNTPGQRQTGNTLIINSGKADVAFGGRAATGDVTGNNVKMTGGELVPGRNDIKIGDYYVKTYTKYINNYTFFINTIYSFKYIYE